MFRPIAKYRPTIRVNGAQPKHIYTWRHALELCFIRSWQGHLEVTARSKQLKVVKNSFFVVFLQIIFTWDVYDGWKPPKDPNTEVHQTHPRRLHELKEYYPTR